MNLKQFRPLAFLFLFLSLPVLAESSQSITQDTAPSKNDLDVLNSFQELEETISDLKTEVVRSSRRKYMQCVMAFGAHEFCKCLGDKSPVGIDFSEYIRVTTSTRVDLGYDQMTDEDKRLVDATLISRDQCVSEEN